MDAVVQPKQPTASGLPILIEAKSAGDFTNTNKRRKEEAQKIRQLKETYGPDIQAILFLCGYFGSDYLGYEAAEGWDWVWEHRIGDLEQLGI
jgi:XamI restriction endonuclease